MDSNGNGPSQSAPGNATRTTPALAPAEIEHAKEIHQRYVRQFEAEWDPWNEKATTTPRDRRQTIDQVIENYFADRVVDEASQARILEAVQHSTGRFDADRRQRRVDALCRVVGPRHADSTFETFTTPTPEQAKHLEAIRRFCGDIRQAVADGAGLILFGPAGSGKTHLAVAAARIAILADFSVEWRDGPGLFSAFRALIDSNGSEQAFLDKLVRPDILVIDDMIPPGGATTQFQAVWLYRIVDSRWRAKKPTWITMNVLDASEADAAVGAPTVDRLRHGALCLRCNFKSQRQARKA